jgi:hypothetical protein
VTGTAGANRRLSPECDRHRRREPVPKCGMQQEWCEYTIGLARPGINVWLYRYVKD